MDSIVVDDDKTGMECIKVRCCLVGLGLVLAVVSLAHWLQYLKEQRIGTAKFIPLETIKPKQGCSSFLSLCCLVPHRMCYLLCAVNESYRRLGGTFKLAIDVINILDEKYAASLCLPVSFPDLFPSLVLLSLSRSISFSSHRLRFARHKKAFEYALGNTLVCHTLEEARKLCYEGAASCSSRLVPLLSCALLTSPALRSRPSSCVVRACRQEEQGGRQQVQGGDRGRLRHRQVGKPHRR